MSYTSSSRRVRYARRRQGGRVAMGDLASTITSAFGTATNIATDPYLPEVLCHLNQLAAIKSGQPVPGCNDTPAGLTGGVGLSDAVVPMRAYVYAKQNPWVLPALAVAIIGIPFALGYSMGKGG